VLLAYTLTESEKGWFAPSSIAFLIVLAAVIIARWLDPHTSDGEPTTPAHLRWFTVSAWALD
jgi:hypothetical protein